MYESQYPETLAGGHFSEFDYQFMLNNHSYRGGDPLLDLSHEYLTTVAPSSVVNSEPLPAGVTANNASYPIGSQQRSSPMQYKRQEEPSFSSSDSVDRGSRSSQEQMYGYGTSASDFQSSANSSVHASSGMYLTSSTPPTTMHLHQQQHGTSCNSLSSSSNSTSLTQAGFPPQAFYAAQTVRPGVTTPPANLHHYVSDPAMYPGFEEYNHQHMLPQEHAVTTPPFYHKSMDDGDNQQQQQQYHHIEQFYGQPDEQQQYFLMQQQQHQLWLQQQQQLRQYSSPSYTTDLDSRPQIYVRKACVACKQSHVACDVQRPCSRCVRLNKADSCVDAERKKRGRPCGSGKKKKEENRDPHAVYLS
ncbi:hypothetical protein DM01DRAFT_1374021 [Hesseltinella vesiculosa]|uniref:Zn(2)-C6 fungal-type domain-containing protein n=1 Tax=Hesseltinella vesiculosa TaxID=101127 RepID=A0A1X2GJT0_9FUNG|nr:hypothetical protein DM01DRAFT_1374021 [Hesseltinella vesiculosa]